MQQIVRVRRISNPRRTRKTAKRSSARRKATRSRSRSNPLRVLTLGASNPRKKRSAKKMATRHGRRVSRVARRQGTRRRKRALAAAPVRRRRRRNQTRVIVRRNRSRRRRNQGAIAGQMQEIFGGLVGVSATKFITSALPPNLTATPIMASLSSIGAAFAAGWVGGMWDKRFGDAVRFGGLMQAGSVMLNAFIPAIGSQLALQGLGGRRGMGELVPGAFPVPQNPLNPAQANYPAYGRGLPAAEGNGVTPNMNGLARAFPSAF